MESKFNSFVYAGIFFALGLITVGESFSDSLVNEFENLKHTQEAEHKKRLLEKPNSEDAHFQFAIFLVGEDRYAEAKSEFNEVLRLNSNRQDARKALIGVEELEKINNPNERAEKKLEITVGALEDVGTDLQAFLDEVKVIDTDEHRLDKERRLSALDQKYNISSYGNYTTYKTTKKEMDMTSLISQYLIAGKVEDVERLHLRRLNEFPDSSAAHVSYIEFLIRRNQFDAVKTAMSYALEKFPGHPELMILQDSLPSVLDATSTELREQRKQDLEVSLRDAADIKLKLMFKKMKTK